MNESRLPRRLERDLTLQRVGAETLVYHEQTHQAFCLNATSSAVWWLCDGGRSVAQIAAAAALELCGPVPEELVRLALQQLRADGLLEASPEPAPELLSRRAMMESLGARALVMLPVVAAILVPEPAQALSGVVTGGTGRKAVLLREQGGRSGQAAPSTATSSDSLVP